MSKIRGFNLRKRLIRVSKWVFRKIRVRSGPGYHRLGNSPRSSIAKLLSWGRKLTAAAKSFFPVSVGSGYAQLGSGSVVGSDRDPTVPKGHLAVYVGQKDGELHRVLVPVIYFNHLAVYVGQRRSSGSTTTVESPSPAGSLSLNGSRPE